MRTQVELPEGLIGALDALGVHYVAGEDVVISPGRALTPSGLVAGLAEQSDPRLRSAIIALLLVRPEFADTAPIALAQLSPPARTTLMHYYTAAVLLQREHAARLLDLIGGELLLPDLFSEELGLDRSADARMQLRQLAERRRQCSGLDLDWFGTFEHVADKVIRRLDLEAQWATLPAMRS